MNCHVSKSRTCRHYYVVMSAHLNSVRSMIIATMALRKSTMTTLFTMLNQWICVSVIFR